jgi:hypothetical protein
MSNDTLEIITPCELREAQRQHAALVEQQTVRLAEPLKQSWLSDVAKAINAQRTKEDLSFDWDFPSPQVPDWALEYDEKSKQQAATLARNEVVSHLVGRGYQVQWIRSNSQRRIKISWEE